MSLPRDTIKLVLVVKQVPSEVIYYTFCDIKCKGYRQYEDELWSRDIYDRETCCTNRNRPLVSAPFTFTTNTRRRETNVGDFRRHQICLI